MFGFDGLLAVIPSSSAEVRCSSNQRRWGMRGSLVPFLTAVLFLFSAAAFAQNSGAIAGNVVDLAGDMVATAPIQATNMATKTVHKATSSEQGRYTIAQLPAGMYELSVNAPGFNLYTRQDVAVAAGQNPRLHIHLFDFLVNKPGGGPAIRIFPIT